MTRDLMLEAQTIEDWGPGDPLPPPPPRRRKKDRRKWCRGRAGIPHAPGAWHRSAHPWTRIWNKNCLTCGKRLDTWYQFSLIFKTPKPADLEL